MAEKSIQDYLREGVSGVGEWASGAAGAGIDLAKSPIGMIAIMAMLTDYINKQQNKNFGTDPYGGAVSDIKAQRDKYSNLFTQSAAGQTTNPQIALMRQMLQNRAINAPLTSPTVTPPNRYSTTPRTFLPPSNYNPASNISNLQNTLSSQNLSPINPIQMNAPARYNPYSAGGAGAGGADADLMANIKSLAMGQGENYQGGMGALQNSLANRFGTRAMREGNLAGKLTPYGAPELPVTPTPPVTPPFTEPYPFNPLRPGLPIGAEEIPRPPVTPYAFDPLRPGIPKGAVEPPRPVTSPYKTAEEAFAAEGLKGLVLFSKTLPLPAVTSQLQLPGNLPPELLEMLKLLMLNTPNQQRPGFLV